MPATTEKRRSQSEEDQKAGQPVSPGPEAFFTEQEQPEERGLQEESEDAFHGQRLADHTTGGLGETGVAILRLIQAKA